MLGIDRWLKNSLYNAQLREREKAIVEIPDLVEIKATSMQEEYSVCGMKSEPR